MTLLRKLSPAEAARIDRPPLDPSALATAQSILDAVRRDGTTAVRAIAERFGDVAPGAPLLLDRSRLENACEALPAETRALLERTADRIRRFARAQRETISDLVVPIAGGEAGHDVVPVARAGCYAPGGRYPLPSSVLMTAVPAKVAGVEYVVVASPRPSVETLAAAFIAGADAVLAVGGAQAVAALALGIDGFASVDVIVGPGNKYVTAAKQLVYGRVGIDMLAGPSELVVLADETADPAVVAADLLAQAEHDDDAVPVLITTDAAIASSVEAQLEAQLDCLPTAETARAALRNGFAVVARDLDEALEAVDRLAPEHLELQVRDPAVVASRVRNAGALFVGSGAAEVLGDYGAGPNHVLPTGGSARFAGGLSVLDFLRLRTWMRIDDLDEASHLVADAAAFGRMEGLLAHARSAEARQRGCRPAL